jgi:hypothetical protein
MKSLPEAKAAFEGAILAVSQMRRVILRGARISKKLITEQVAAREFSSMTKESGNEAPDRAV